MALPEIDGFDLNGAVARLRGKQDRVVLLLNSLYTNNKDARIKLEEFTAANDLDGAKRLVHQIKGSAASLGAEALSAQAAQLEITFQAAEIADIDTQLSLLQQRLDELEKCVELINQSDVGSVKRMCQLLHDIEKHLHYDLAKSLSLVEELKLNFSHSQNADVVDLVERQLIDFRLDDLRTTIRSFISKHD